MKRHFFFLSGLAKGGFVLTFTIALLLLRLLPPSKEWNDGSLYGGTVALPLDHSSLESQASSLGYHSRRIPCVICVRDMVFLFFADG